MSDELEFEEAWCFPHQQEMKAAYEPLNTAIALKVIRPNGESIPMAVQIRKCLSIACIHLVEKSICNITSKGCTFY